MPLMSMLVLAPVAGAMLILFLVPEDRHDLIRRTGLTAAVIPLLTACYLFCNYDLEAGGYQFQEKYEWCSALGISFHLGVDGINLVLVLLTSICSFAGVWLSFSVRERVKEFFIFYLALVTGCLGVLSALDIFFIYFFYETAVIPVYPLIGVWGSGRKEYATMKLTLYLTAGAVLALTGLIWLYTAAGLHSFDLVELEKHLAAHPLDAGLQRTIFPFIMVGFGVIVTLWPFHSWSPIGYASAPTSVSMLHAGVLKKLGAYAILRLAINLLPMGAEHWMPWVAGIAVINIVYCGSVALTQRDLKYILGYSSCSHMGFIFLGLSSLNTFGINGLVFFMFAHGVMAALGFAVVGWCYEKTHTRMVDELGGLAKVLPFIGTCFMLSALASSGVPGFANFPGEFMILLGAWDAHPVAAVGGVLGLVITATYMLKTVRMTLFGPLERHKDIPDAQGLARGPYLLLAAALIFFGFFPSYLMNTIVTGTRPLLERLEHSRSSAAVTVPAAAVAATQHPEAGR